MDLFLREGSPFNRSDFSNDDKKKKKHNPRIFFILYIFLIFVLIVGYFLVENEVIEILVYFQSVFILKQNIFFYLEVLKLES